MAKEYVKSPMNYIGNKFRIIDQIQKWFPKDINTMVDLFCGGCDVTINTDAKNRYANDINYHLVEILEEFQKYSTDYILGYIDGRIDHWHLSKTDIEAYKAFRQYYNETKNPLDLYVLMCYSFNYQFRFNSNHEYNNPFGKNRSSFNNTMRENLIRSLDKLTDVHFTTSQFQDYDYDVLDTGDFLYADPPYLITCGSYNDGKRGFTGWGEKEERDLYGILDDLDNRGVNFALSNVIEHKGKTNTILKDWYKDRGYHLHNIKFDYNNSNYQTRNKENVTKEILITNY